MWNLLKKGVGLVGGLVKKVPGASLVGKIGFGFLKKIPLLGGLVAGGVALAEGKGLAVAAVEGVKGAFGSIIGAATGLFGGLINSEKGFTNTVVGGVTGFFSGLINGTFGNTDNPIMEAKKALQSLGSSAQEIKQDVVGTAAPDATASAPQTLANAPVGAVITPANAPAMSDAEVAAGVRTWAGPAAGSKFSGGGATGVTGAPEGESLMGRASFFEGAVAALQDPNRIDQIRRASQQSGTSVDRVSGTDRAFLAGAEAAARNPAAMAGVLKEMTATYGFAGAAPSAAMPS